MVRAEILDGNLILHMVGMDKVWALKSELTVPLQHIARARVDEAVVKQWFHGIKMPGTSLPGVITAGTFYQDGKRVFWDIHHPERAVVISLAHDSYDELVIEVENPEVFVANLQGAIAG